MVAPKKTSDAVSGKGADGKKLTEVGHLQNMG